MDQDPKALIEKQFLSLPKPLQVAIQSVDTLTILQGLAKKYDLRIDQISELHSETLMVMLGLQQPADFISNLQDALEIPRETAQKLGEEVSSNIFEVVRDEMVDAHHLTEAKDDSTALTNASAAAQPPAPKSQASLPNLIKDSMTLQNSETTPPPSPSPSAAADPDPYREPIQ